MNKGGAPGIHRKGPCRPATQLGSRGLLRKAARQGSHQRAEDVVCMALASSGSVCWQPAASCRPDRSLSASLLPCTPSAGIQTGNILRVTLRFQFMRSLAGAEIENADLIFRIFRIGTFLRARPFIGAGIVAERRPSRRLSCG